MKRRNRFFRMTSLILVFALMLSLLPTQVLAQSETRSFAEVEKHKTVAAMSSNEQVVNQAIEDIKKLPEDFFDNAARNSSIYESESNDSFDLADIIYDSYDVYGSLGVFQDTDYFKVTFSKAGAVNFYITCSSHPNKSPNYQIFIYNSAKKHLANTSYSSSKVITLDLPAGAYYIRVVGSDDGGENYFNKSETYLLRCKWYPTATLNVPLYKQETTTTCGPASVRMILAY